MIAPINDRATFRALSRQGRHGKVEQLQVRALLATDATVKSDHGAPWEPDTVRVAYAISRRVGNAVVRNRLRRRLRAILTECHQGADGQLEPGAYLFIAEPGLAEISYADLGKRVRTVIDGVRSVALEHP